MKYLLLTWSNLNRRKLRTTLTLLSIVVAFVLFGLLCSIKQALTGGVQTTGLDRLVVRHKVSIIQLLPQSYQARIQRIPGVKAAMHQTFFGGYYQDRKNSAFHQSPVVPEEFLAMYPEIIVPAEQKKAWMQTRTGCIVGRNLAKQFNWKIGDKIPVFSTIWKRDGKDTWEFDIVGIYDSKTVPTSALYFRYDYFDEARQERAKGKVGWYSVRVSDPSRAAEISKLVDKEFENSSEETKTEPEGAFVQGFVKQIGNIALITSSIMAAVFFTILLVTGNTMSQAVRERTGELGVLKAIGFTSTQVLVLVMLESCVLSGAGGAIGLGLGWLITSGGDPTGVLPMFYFPTRDLLLGVGLALALGVVTGIPPAVQAMRLRVANALRRM